MTHPGWTPACRVEDLEEGTCKAVAGELVLLARVDGEVVAYRNRCLHQGAPLHDGLIRDGTLTCPMHFWRYRLVDGRKVGSNVALEPVPVTVVDGEIEIIPPQPAPSSMRDLLLEHARTWRREA